MSDYFQLSIFANCFVSRQELQTTSVQNGMEWIQI